MHVLCIMRLLIRCVSRLLFPANLVFASPRNSYVVALGTHIFMLQKCFLVSWTSLHLLLQLLLLQLLMLILFLLRIILW